MKKIILTGGGTAGHVTPNIALIPWLKEKGYDIHYIGTYNGIEKKLIEDQGIPYYPISSGKLRRYFDVKNFTDPFKVVKGLGQATHIIRKIKPDVIFSKGGFVTVPVIIGGYLNRIPTIIHESDMTPGLANKIGIPLAKAVCTNFPETLCHIPNNKGIHTGTPIRQELFEGTKFEGYRATGFSENRPVILVMGGSLGSVKINTALREALPTLLKSYQIVHICGKGNLDNDLMDKTGYKQFEYVKENLSHIFAIADIMISRAGANSISEILALKIPNILIPLSASASRGDQILNANSFKKQGFSFVLNEENLSTLTLIQSIDDVYKNRLEYITTMKTSKATNGIDSVLLTIEKYEKKKKE